MSEPAFQRVEELFHQAVEMAAERRAAFLDAACGGDAALRGAVQQLLDHDAADDAGFLASPVARPAGASDAPTLAGLAPAAGPAPAVPGYEIANEIGRGGMGVVYQARQLNLNRLVALKMLLPGAPADLEPLARFRTEAEVLARLHHPNIVPIYDIGEHEKRPFFTMEYVAGPNLARVLDRRPQEPFESARLIETLARAVHAAHQCGVIHRDLKPANVLLAQPAGNGAERPPLTACEPHITDFGLAKDTTASPGLTQTGAAMGTPCYMAPEQARGDRKLIGPATDIYALGAILYEMLTGRPPFDAGTPAETIGQVVRDDPPSPSRLRPRLPRDLVTICMKCLEKSPRRRYASALDLAEDLRRFQAGEPIRARRAGPVERMYRWCVRRPLVASLLALLAVLSTAFVVTVVVYEMRLREALQLKLSAEESIVAEQQRRIIRLDVTIGTIRQDDGDAFTALLYFTEALRLDGAMPAHDPDCRARVAAVLRRSPRLVQLQTFDAPILCARIGEAGIQAAFAADHRIEVRDLATGLPVAPAIAVDAPPTDGAFSPDGGRLALIDAAGEIRVWDVNTAQIIAGPATTRRTVRRVYFSTDGERIMLAGADGFTDLHDARTGGWIASLEERDRREPLQASPDGNMQVGGDAAGTARVWEAATGRPVVPPLRPGGPVKAAAFRPEGKQIVVVGGDGVVCTWDLAPAPGADEDRSAEELTALAQVLACARLDWQELRPLDAAGLQEAWDRLRREP